MSFMDRVMGGKEQRPQSQAGKVLPMVSLEGAELQSLHGKVLQIENQVTKYKKMVDKLGTGADTTDFRRKMGVLKNSIQDQAKKLKEQLLAFSTKKEQLDTSQQSRLQKAVASYATVLDDFHKTIKLSSEREIANQPRAALENEVAMEKQSLLGGEVEQRQQQQQQQAIQMDNLLAHNEAIIEERDQEIGELVRDIAELNEMFQDVAVLVHDQGMMVDDIESNIAQTAGRVEAAQKELVQAERHQKRATSKKLWLLLCTIIILGIIVAAIVLLST